MKASLVAYDLMELYKKIELKIIKKNTMSEAAQTGK